MLFGFGTLGIAEKEGEKESARVRTKRVCTV